jgi:hypothetical protein
MSFAQLIHVSKFSFDNLHPQWHYWSKLKEFWLQNHLFLTGGCFVGMQVVTPIGSK